MDQKADHPGDPKQKATATHFGWSPRQLTQKRPLDKGDGLAQGSIYPTGQEVPQD